MKPGRSRRPRRCQMYTAEINFPKAGIYYPRTRCDGIPVEYVTYGNGTVGLCSRWLCASHANPEMLRRQGWNKIAEVHLDLLKPYEEKQP